MPVLLGLAVAALAAGVPVAAEAHYEDSHQYLKVDMTVLEYEVREYDVREYGEFNLVRVELQIDNQEEFDIWDARFYLGGLSDADDPFSAGSEFGSISGAAIRDIYDTDASDSDCAESLPNLLAGTSGRISTCYVVGKTFEPDGLRLFQSNTHDAHPESRQPYDPHHLLYVSSDDPMICESEIIFGEYIPQKTDNHDEHICSGRTQVIPFHSDSSYCALYGSYCDTKNVQDIGAIPKPAPKPEPVPEPEPPASTALLYALYNNNTGTLTLVFDRPVVAQNPDRIGLIHDIEAYIDDGAAPGPGRRGALHRRQQAPEHHTGVRAGRGSAAGGGRIPPDARRLGAGDTVQGGILGGRLCRRDRAYRCGRHTGRRPDGRAVGIVPSFFIPVDASARQDPEAPSARRAAGQLRGH